eukprot:303047_1
MFTRNLQNVSKGASKSNTHKYAILHAHKHHTITNHSLSSSNSAVSTSSIHIKPNHNSSIHASLTHHTNYRFSTTQKQSTLNIIPSHIKLSTEQRNNLNTILNELQHNEQAHTVQFIQQQLKTPHRKQLTPSLIEHLRLQPSRTLPRDTNYLVLSYIESSPSKSIDSLQSFTHQSSKDIAQAIVNSCKQCETQQICHAWLNSTTDSVKATKPIINKGTKPIIKHLEKHLKVKAKSMIIAYSQKHNLKPLQDMMVYVLALDPMHKLPSWALSIATDVPTESSSTQDVSSEPTLLAKDVKTDDVQTQSVPLSVAEPISVVSKRNQPTVKDAMPSSIDINDASAASQNVVSTPQQGTIVKTKRSKKKRIVSKPPVDESSSAPSNAFIDLDLIERVKQVQEDIGREAKKQEYRAQHLAKWDASLHKTKEGIEKDKEETKQKNDQIQQQQRTIHKKEHNLVGVAEDLRWGTLKHKFTASEIESKNRNLNIMEQTLNEQHSEQSVVQKELHQTQKALEAQDKELRERLDSICTREQTMQDVEQQLRQRVVKLKEFKTQFEEEGKIIKQKEKELTEEDHRIQSQRQQIDQEMVSLQKDKAEWDVRRAAFKQRDDELFANEAQYVEDSKVLNEQKQQNQKDAKIIKIETEKNMNKAQALDAMEQRLQSSENVLTEMERTLHSTKQTLKREEKEFNVESMKARKELQSKQDAYDSHMQTLAEEQHKLTQDQDRLEIEQRELKEKQAENEKNKTQLEKEQKEVQDTLKSIAEQQLDIARARNEIASQQVQLQQQTQQLQRNEHTLQQNQEKLKKDEKHLSERREEVITQEKDINDRFVRLNTERNQYNNEKMKTQQLQNELNTQQKQLEAQFKQSEAKEQDIAQRYAKMHREEQEVMRKIEPIKQKTKELDAQQETLEKKERMNAELQYRVDMQKAKNTETQQQLMEETKTLKDEQSRLEMAKKQLQTKKDRILQEDKRIVEMYDKVNKERYEMYKSDRDLTSKQTEIAERELKLETEQQNMNEVQIKVEQETQDISQRKEALEMMEDSFNLKRNQFEIAQKEFEQNTDKYKSDEAELEKALHAYDAQKQQLEQERVKIDSERHLIKEERAYIRQQTQALNGQKTVLDADKVKLDSKSLLLTSQMEQVNHEKEAQNVIKSKLEKINSDLQSAQRTHKEEDEKLRIWNEELQKAQLQLDELKPTLDQRAKVMEQESLALSQKEIELQKMAASLQQQQTEVERQKVPQDTLDKLQQLEQKAIIVEEQEKAMKREAQIQTEKAELVELTKQQILVNLNDIKQKENKLLEEQEKVSAALKDAEDTKHALRIDITRKESELSGKEQALTDRGIVIANQERHIRDKETELKQAEDALLRKEKELSLLQHDVNTRDEQMKREMEQKSNAMQEERVYVDGEKIKLTEQRQLIELSMEEQKTLQKEREEALNEEIVSLRSKYDELQSELQAMETTASQYTQTMKRLTDENTTLMNDKHLLQRSVARNEERRPTEEEKRELKQQQIEIANEQQRAKHCMSSLKRRENIIASKENTIAQQQQKWIEKHNQQHKQQDALESMARNLQKELSLAEKRQKDATEIERIANEKAQFVTDLQKHLERTQNTLQRKDDLIQGMHHKYSDLHSKYIPQQQLQTNLERMQDKSHQKDVLIHRLQNELSQLKLQMHDKTQRLSVLDTPKDDVTSVPIRIAKPAVISKRNTEPLQGTATPEAIPISDITSTAIEPPHIQPQVQLVSVPLSIADPTPMTSKRNAPIHGKVIAQSILTNDPLTASTEVLKPAHAMTMEQDAIPTQYIASVPLCPAAPTSKVSKRNTYERSSYTQPQSIPTNDPLDASTEVLKPAHAMVMDQDVIPTQYIASVPLRPAAPTTKVSKRNTPPLASYTQPQAIPTNDPLNASVEVLKPAHAMAIDTNVIPTPYTASVPFCSAAPTSKISKRNTPKLPSYAQPQSIEINPAKAPSFSLLTAPQQRVLFVEDEAEDLPPKRPSKPPLPPRDTDKPRRYKPYPTKFRISVPEKTRIVEAVVVPPLSVAQPTLATSKRNPPNIREITPSSIDINDPTQGSETMIAATPQLVTTDALHLPSVPLSVAEPVSVVSKRNQPRIKYVTPSSIDINDVSLTSESVVAVPQQLGSVIDSALSRPIPTANTASIPLSAAQPRSAISKRNLPKPEYIPPSAITISDPNTTSQHVVSVPTEIATEAVMPSVSLQVAEPISPISRRNESKINYVTPSSIAINDVFTTAETVIAAPPQASMDDSNVIAEQAVSAPFHVDPSQIEAVTDSLPPKDMITTAHIPSVALRKAEPIPLDISSRNVSKPGEIVAASIAINDVTTAKRVLSRPAASLRPNRSVIASPCPESVHGRRISFLHLIGTPPAPCIKTEYMAHSPHMWHPQDTHPALIPVNEPETLLPKVVLQPPRVLLDVSLRAAPLISNLSRHNQPKLGYKRASSIHTSTITDDTLNHPSKQTQLIDSSKLVQDLLNLKQLHGTQEGAVDSELDIDPEPILTEIPEAEPEPELQSGLTAVDIDRVFECRTNSDLLFDDVVHFETIFLGLDAELRDYLSECRECKSITNPLPSTFRRDIADLRPDESNVFNGDVVCCVQWEVDNKHLLTIMDDIDGLMHKCEEHIDSNRALMEEYRRVMRNDEICSTSNRNKLKKQMNGQNKKEINDIEKEKKSEFGNDLSEELLELQYQNSEWLLLRETLAEWKGFIESAQRNDSGAFNSSDKLYLRSFCILPSQEQSARNHLTNRLNRIDHELRNRRWVKELNHLLSNEHNCNVLYGEMGPDVASWEDKLLARDLTAYLLNGAAFELHSTVSSRIPLSEGFVRIGYQAQLLIESAQSLLGHMDPFVERIIIEAQNWCNRNNKVYGNHPQKTLESSLKNGLDLSSIDALTLRDKMPLLRGKLLENDTKYQSLFGDPLRTDLDELLHEMNTRTIDHKYIAKLHTIFNSKFKLTQLYLFLILKCDFTRISLASTHQIPTN